MLDGGQGKMLISLLDKPYKKIKIDRLIEKEGDRRKLLVSPSEVLEKTKNHHQRQFRLRSFDSKIFEERWSEVYKPKKTIEEHWYSGLN